jgi:hypothetical protein
MTSPLIIELARRFDEVVKRLRDEGYVAARIDRLNELIGGDIREIPKSMWPYGVENRGDYILLYPSISRILTLLCEKKVLRLLQ